MTGRDAGIDPQHFADLLAGAQAGNGRAWEGLYRWLAPTVAGYLRVQGAADADDLTSEVFLALVRTIGSFRGDASQFRSFVFVIAHRRLVDSRRRQSRRAARFDTEELHDDVTGPNATDAGDEALRHLATERVVAMCDRLAPDQRDVIVLRIVADLTIDQIAGILGKSPGAVKQLQRRAFEQIRRQIEREGQPRAEEGDRTPMGPDDDYPDMGTPALLDDAAIDAIVAGDDPDLDTGLAEFVALARSVASGVAPTPSAALASLFENGVPIPTTESARTAPTRRRRFARFAGMSIGAKLAWGVGVAAAATGGAGTAGVLPDPLQHRFAEVFDGVLPFEIEDPVGDDQGALVIEVGAPEPRAVASTTTTSTTSTTTTTATVAPPTVPPTTPELIVVPPPPDPEPTVSEPTVPEPAPPSTTTTTEPVPAVEELELSCTQHWVTGARCEWSPSSHVGSVSYFLLKDGPDGSESQQIFGENPTSYIDIHTEPPHTYTFRVEARLGDGTVVARSGIATVTMT